METSFFTEDMHKKWLDSLIVCDFIIATVKLPSELINLLAIISDGLQISNAIVSLIGELNLVEPP